VQGSRGPRRPDPRDPVERTEREAIECLLQVPNLVPPEYADALGEDAFDIPAYRAVHQAVRGAGGVTAAQSMSPAAWAEAVQEAAPETVRQLVSELAVVPLPDATEEAQAKRARLVILKVAEMELARLVGNLHSKVQRMGPNDAAWRELYAELTAAEVRRHALRHQISGG